MQDMQYGTWRKNSPNSIASDRKLPPNGTEQGTNELERMVDAGAGVGKPGKELYSTTVV